MKLSPLHLFIILLLVLVIATTAGKMTEGFASSSDLLVPTRVSGYDNSSDVIKIYDTYHFDPRNGNTVITNGANELSVIERDNESTITTIKKGAEQTSFSQVSDYSKRRGVPDRYNLTTWENADANILETRWGQKTYIYVLQKELVSAATVTGNTATVSGNTTSSVGIMKPVLTVSYDGSSRNGSSKSFDDFSATLVPTYTAVSATNQNKFVDVTGYKRVYKIIPTVLYDVSNGTLLVKNGTSYDGYERGASEKSSKSLTDLAAIKTLNAFEEQPSFIADPEGNNTVIYHPLGEYTRVLIVSNAVNSDGKLLGIYGQRFDMNGVFVPPSSDTGANEEEEEQTKNDNQVTNGELLDAFSKWYMYFYGSNMHTDVSLNGYMSNDYLLKTQIVPPVCPACPGCQSGNGVCTDCGGQGGSGTKDTSGSLAFSDGKTVIGATGNAVSNAVGATGNVLSNTVGATGNVLNKTVDTAGNVATNVVGKTLDTAEKVVGKTFDTAGNVVEKTFDTAGNILGAAGRAVGLDRVASGLDRVGYQQSYRGPVNTSTSANATGYSTGVGTGYNRNQTGVSSLPQGNPMDPYSYNGKLQSKGANFIGLTADFSKFGR